MASDWTRFRGPNGSGVAEEGALPNRFGPNQNVVWQTLIPSGKSSSTLTGKRVYLTAHNEGKLLTLALDSANGKILSQRMVPDRRLESMHRLNDEAAPTPVTDGTNIYVFLGAMA